MERAIDLGLFQGVTEETFGWGQPMSRAAFAAALKSSLNSLDEVISIE